MATALGELTAVKSTVTRRMFWIGVGGTAVALVAAAVAFLRPRVQGEADAGEVTTYPIGTIRHFHPGGNGYVTTEERLFRGDFAASSAANGFFVVRRADGLVAFSDRCTHLGATVVWDSAFAYVGLKCHAEGAVLGNRVVCTTGPATLMNGASGAYRCPAHGAVFTLDEGEPFAGPGPRSLDVLPIRTLNGRVLVTIDPSARKRRSAKERASPVPI